MSERLHRDVHPAEVLLPDGSLHTGVRVFVTDGRLLAYRSDNGRIEKAFDLEVERPVTVTRDRGSLFGRLQVNLADGGVAWVNQGRGCGCGSPLKALGPPAPW